MSMITKVAGVGAVAALLAGGAYAWAGEPSTSNGRHGGSHEPAKNDVKAYYGDTRDAEGHHHASADSDWAKDTARQVDRARRDFRLALDHHVRHPAIVLDVDDTSEVTFGFNADNDFGYDPVKAEHAIGTGQYPAIEPTLRFANWAAQHGAKVFFLTGRPERQRASTLKNLANEGYPAPADASSSRRAPHPTGCPAA